MKVTEVSRKGSEWAGFKGRLGGALAGTGSGSEALWVRLFGTDSGDRLSERGSVLCGPLDASGVISFGSGVLWLWEGL